MIPVMRRRNEELFCGMKRIEIPKGDPLLFLPEAKGRKYLDVPEDWSDDDVKSHLHSMRET